MKILFINPRYDETKFRYRVNKIPPPLGMAYISSMLINENHNVEILDMEVRMMEWKSLPKYLEKRTPDIIAIFGTTPISNYIAKCAKIAREAYPNSTILLGGPHASLLPEKALNGIPQIDFILRGEAEYTFLELVKGIENKEQNSYFKTIDGIGFREDEELYISQEMPKISDLDSLPLPAYDLLDLDAYNGESRLAESGHGERFMTIMSSRGCPNNCIFCSAPVLYGHKYRARSAKNIVNEMIVLKEQYNISHIIFYDASFMCDIQRVKDICNEIINQSLTISWRVRCRSDHLDEDLCVLMKKAGCTTLAIGVETGTQKLLNVLNKHSKLEQIEKTFATAKKAGLWTVAYFIFGIPGETYDDALKTIEFAKNLDPDWALFAHATPLPGTKLLEMTKDNISTEDYSKYKWNANSPVLSYDKLNNADLHQLMEKAYQSFYIREEWLLNRLKKATSEAQIDNIINSFFYYLNKKDKLQENELED